MARLRIRNVGPIRAGLDTNDGFLEFAGVTLFVGDQGSGKSTVAKLYSTLSWLEKALVRKEFTITELEGRSLKNLLMYQNIHNYIDQNEATLSEIEYCGVAYTIAYRNKKIHVTEQQRLSYAFPKIMYVPAERNFGSTVKGASGLRDLPLTLYTFLEEYEAAKAQLTQNQEIPLPAKGAKFKYHPLTNTSYIVGNDYQINLLEASSGFQSMTPLFLVTRYLSDYISEGPDATRSALSIRDKRNIELEKIKIIHNDDLSEEEQERKLQQIEQLYDYKNLLHVVEEPEQNLYPTTQKKLLFELLKYGQARTGDRLILTTHSLYMVSYLSQCMQAYEVVQSLNALPKEQQEPCFAQLERLVPLEAALNPERVRLYELDEAGTIRLLEKEEGLPPDDHPLNLAIEQSNESFIELLQLLSNGE